MSVKIMGAVWDAPLPTTQKFVLLALADHADHEGGNIFPAVATIARKCNLTERGVQKAIRALVKAGLLILERQGNGRKTNLWRIDVQQLNALIVSASEPTERRTTFTPEVNHVHPRGEPRSPDPSYNHPTPGPPFPPISEGTPVAPSGAQASKTLKEKTPRKPRATDALSDLIAKEAFSAPKGTAHTSITAGRLIKDYCAVGDETVQALTEQVRGMYAWWRTAKPHLSAPGKYEAISRAMAEYLKTQPALSYEPVQQPDGTFKREWVKK